jgi:hypothetical protein
MKSAWITPFLYEQLNAERVRMAHRLTLYDAPTRTYHTVPVGFESDGATIPRGLPRRLAGHPLHRAYLPAAVLHDYEIVTRAASWWRVHLRFRRALRASGVSWWRSAAMTLAVFTFGPRW